jgi:8-oxo-dGTP pyrophosphatase MutT (NUDIX family)
MTVVKEKSAGVIVYFKNKKKYEFLLLHYPGGHWCFPKGHIEKGETTMEAALRELEEETNIKNVQFEKNFFEKIHYFFTDKNKNLISKEVYFYLAKVAKKDVKISHEHKGFIWLEYKKARKKITFDNTREILDKAYIKITR